MEETYKMNGMGELLHIYADATLELEKQYNDFKTLFKTLIEKYESENKDNIKNNLRDEMITCKENALKCKEQLASVFNLIKDGINLANKKVESFFKEKEIVNDKDLNETSSETSNSDNLSEIS